MAEAMDIKQFWRAVLAQNEGEIIANCEYPGEWEGEVERVETVNDLIITVTLIYPKDRSAYYHATSFIQTKDGKITAMDEYYADDGAPPQWRLDKRIGTPVK